MLYYYVHQPINEVEGVKPRMYELQTRLKGEIVILRLAPETEAYERYC